MELIIKNGKYVLQYNNTPKKILLLWRRKFLYLRLNRLHYKWKKVNRALVAYPDVPIVHDWTWKGDKTHKDYELKWVPVVGSDE